EVPAQLAQTDSIALYRKGRTIVQSRLSEQFRLVARSCFDEANLRCYLTAGGAFLPGEKVVEVQPESRRLRLRSLDGQVRLLGYQWLVAADGAASLVRQQVDPRYRLDGYSLEAKIEPLTQPSPLRIFYDYIPGGYAWIFPTSIGLGGRLSDWPAAKAQAGLAALTKHYNLRLLEKPHGARLPWQGRRVRPAAGHILLTGDAAGLLDPITGEGIYAALYSGYQAAQVLLMLPGTDEGQILSKYRTQLRPLQRRFGRAARFKRHFFNDFCFARLQGHDHIMQVFCEQLVQHYRGSYLGFFTKETLRAARRRLFG
ncbi:MAG: hypothetical protein LBL67_01185, partial [Coriobacteriales bacterium]|nr:hypothetical protein [Coriobacteriales bacterium]